MSTIVWLPEALEDAKRLFDFLKNKNLAATARAAQTIQKGASTLANFPEIGRPMNDGTDRRELFIPFGEGSYVLRYIISAQTIVIIRVWHSRERREKPLNQFPGQVSGQMGQPSWCQPLYFCVN